MPFYYRYDCIHMCQVWYELFEKQMKYYRLFRVLLWEFASVYDETLDKFCLQLLHNLAVCGIDMAEFF